MLLCVIKFYKLKKTVILQILPFSFPSGCGIWSRAYNDSVIFNKKGYISHIFSSNILKGTRQKLVSFEEYSNIKIHRFHIILKLGGSAMFFTFVRKFFQVKPDVVIVHGYRHPASLLGLILSKLSGKKVFITTHAPFWKDPNRSVLMKLIDVAYDLLIGWWELRLYNKIIMVAKWEEEVLKKRFKLSKKRLIHISNSIAEEFIENSGKALEERMELISFSLQHRHYVTPTLQGHGEVGRNPSLIEGSFGDNLQRRQNDWKDEGVANGAKTHPVIKEGKVGLFPIVRSAFYMGRIDPTKRPEWVLSVAKELPDYDFYIGGPINNYDKFESDLKNVEIEKFVFKKSDFMNKAKEHLVFLMPSIRETFGLTMVEAMSQACIVISSDTKGAREFIIDGQNGFIVHSPKEMAEKLEQISKMNPEDIIKIINNALETARKYDSRIIGEKLISLIEEVTKSNK